MLCLAVSHPQEILFCFQTPDSQSLRGICRECVLIDNHLVKVVFKVISAHAASVSVIDREVRALWPLPFHFFPRGFCHVEDDRYAILIVVPLDPLMRVRCVTRDQAVRLRGELSFFKVLKWVLLLEQACLRHPVEVRPASRCEQACVPSWVLSLVLSWTTEPRFFIPRFDFDSRLLIILFHLLG